MTSPNPPQSGPEASENPASIWAPWRLDYLESLDDQGPPPKKNSPTGCFLSDYWLSPEDDQANHVIVRTDRGMIMLNAYPYANGHLLVALGDARPAILDYDAEQRAAFWSLVEHAGDLMQRVLNPQGINFGINQGAAAGAALTCEDSVSFGQSVPCYPVSCVALRHLQQASAGTSRRGISHGAGRSQNFEYRTLNACVDSVHSCGVMGASFCVPGGTRFELTGCELTSGRVDLFPPHDNQTDPVLNRPLQL